MACTDYSADASSNPEDALASFKPYVLAITRNFLAARPVLANLADDARQEALLAAWRALTTWKEGKSSRRTWVVLLVRQALIQLWRANRLRGKTVDLEDVEVASDEDVAEQLLLEDFSRAVAAAVYTSPRPKRQRGAPRVVTISPEEVFLKVRLHGQTLEEVGDELGVSRQRVHQVVREVEPRFLAWAAEVRAEAG